jgi:16S rRNA G966 N2-methylase RsmD
LPGSDIGENEGIVVLDAFCGCGGNAIAFGKIPRDKISLVVCVDIDRSKLRKAAYNASLYDIPNDKLVFIECNTMFVLMQCYKNGELVVDKLGADVANMPASVETEDYAGYRIGGLESLPTRIDAVFMDPVSVFNLRRE